MYPAYLTPAEHLAKAKRDLGINQVVCICGSTRFMNAMTEEDRRITVAGGIVVRPGADLKSQDPLWSDLSTADLDAMKSQLDALHRAKIRLADWVLVVGDYIGDSTRAEIAYARELGTPVTFTHPEVDPDASA